MGNATAISGVPSDAGLEKPTFQELFTSNVRFVWRVLAAHGVRASEAKDAAQEVFLVAHRRMDDWDPNRASARAWLHAIAIRVAANHRRLAHVRRESLEDADPSYVPEPGEAIDRNRMIARVYDVLSRLTDDEREVIVLFELQGLSMKEVAETIGCPIRTAYRRLNTARASILAALERDAGEERA